MLDSSHCLTENSQVKNENINTYHPLSIYLIVYMYSSIRIVNLCFHRNKILYQLEYKVYVQRLSLVLKIPLIMEIPWSAPFNLHPFIRMFPAFVIQLAYLVIFCIPFPFHKLLFAFYLYILKVTLWAMKFYELFLKHKI